MRRVFLALAVLLAASSLSAQSVDEIINKYVQTAGGMDRIEAVKSLRRTGKFTGGGGFEAQIVEENKRPNMVRQEFTFGGMTGVTAYDGKNGWKIEPWQGKKDPEPLGEDEMKGILEDSDLDGPLVNYKAKGNKVEYLGTEPIEGSDTWKLQVTLKTGDILTYYIDSENNVPIRIDRKRFVRGAERESVTTLGNYKQVNGWYLPFAIEQGQKGSQFRQKTTYDTITANVTIDDLRFAQPSGAGLPAEQRQGQAVDASQTLPKQAAGGAPGSATPAETTAPSASTLPQATAPSGPAKFDSETISGLGARNIGSAAMSGRISAIAAVHEGNRLTVFIGSASGGVWRSKDGGTSYKPVFDKQPVQSIGAIAIDPKNPRTVWVGSGEAWTRNSVSFGDGIYKSTDGGENWTNAGLPNSERIAKIIVDPSDTNSVYVCVPGRLFSDSDDRGVYKTTDGGKSWNKILKGANASTGCSMLSLDSKNPKTIYAGMWDFRRKGWTFRSGGDGEEAPSGSGLFKSTDGGATWSSLDDKSAPGLPTKPWGRVAVTVAPSNSNVVYAFIEAAVPKNALYRSDDGGKTWDKRDRSQWMIWRPFYFANLVVDPKDENKVYKPDGAMIGSTDGGKSFSYVGGGAHGDFHDLWIDPENPDRMIVGDDGGVWYSFDGANKWWKGENLPVSQFYHVSVDMDRPYHVYGGLQDNSSWVGTSQYPGGITNHQWENIYGGDGFWVFVDPTDNDYIYAESQGGDVARVNRKTHETRSIKPLPQYNEGKLRYNWNTPIHVSPSGAVYVGSQFLFRTKDHGQTWDRISPDLSTNDKEKQKQEQSGGVTVDNSSAEMHTTVYSVSESPKNPQVIWAGTDDGNLQVTRDDGKNWTNVIGNIAGLPKSAWVSYIDAGHFDEGTAYTTFDLHTFGDFKPYAYKTSDYGKTWTSLVPADAPVKGYAHVIREDLVNRDLLFLGTELGLWVSIDGGKQWAQYKGGDLPNVAVRDLAIHPRDNDLVIATHGRGIWIVDDITPLRTLTPEVLAKEVAFVPNAPSEQGIPSFGGWVNGDAAFVGPNAPDGGIITYYQRRRHVFGDLTIEVKDAGGKVVGTVPSSMRRGLNRVTWPMRMKAPKAPTAATAGVAIGPRLLPGTYTVTMTKDRNTYTTPISVVMDPRAKYTVDDRKAEFDLAMKLYNEFSDMTDVVNRINHVRLALDNRAAKLPASDALAKRLRAASAQVDELRKKIVATKEGGMITGEERLRENLSDLYFAVVFYEGPPSRAQIDRTAAIGRELADVSKAFDTWSAKELPGINDALAKKKLAKVEPLSRQASAKESSGSGAASAGAFTREMFEKD